MEALIFDILGWAAAFLLLLAYGLVSFGKVAPGAPAYQWMNITASLLLAANTLYHRAYPSSFVNVIWAVIALVAILNIRRNHAKSAGAR